MEIDVVEMRRQAISVRVPCFASPEKHRSVRTLPLGVGATHSHRSDQLVPPRAIRTVPGDIARTAAKASLRDVFRQEVGLAQTVGWARRPVAVSVGAPPHYVSKVARTGAWSLVPTSFSTGHAVARAASASLAIT